MLAITFCWVDLKQFLQAGYTKLIYTIAVYTQLGNFKSKLEKKAGLTKLIQSEPKTLQQKVVFQTQVMT